MIGMKPAADDFKDMVDGKEVNFSKLQGKTYPSLVVFVRPTMVPRENVPNDRSVLDGKVKTVLMHAPAKFTEWLIQQGLIRSEMDCHLHPGTALKLGLYSEVNRFPYSGGYVWISECCKQKFSSVYNGSIFESSIHTPSVLLKLIYHWSCQTNVQNVVQWVKVNNLFIKQFYTHLRAVCTVALYNHFGLLGGPGKRIEVGVISLGTSSADGGQRQVKVEVLGIYDPETQQIRLRAVEPLPYSEKVYRKRFLKILEPLVDWVHEDTCILTDQTVDKVTLYNYGFRNVIQTNLTSGISPQAMRMSNVTIMDYLRRVVPRMFQNTLSLLNRSMIQQFLDELVWREIFGNTPNTCYDHMLRHISDQTRINQRDRLIARLTKVALNPFKNWRHSGNAVNSNNQKAGSGNVSPQKQSHVVQVQQPPVRKAAAAAAAAAASKQKKGSSSTAARPHVTGTAASTSARTPPRSSGQASLVTTGKRAAPPAAPQPAAKRPYVKKAAEQVETVALEGYYYGIHVPRDSEVKRDSSEDLAFEVKCPECALTFVTNLELQDHLFDHVVEGVAAKYQCRYCFDRFRDHDILMRHIMDAHSIEVTRQGAYYDLICEQKFATSMKLATHMLRSHYPSELPYHCGVCTFASSSRRMTVDHFYEEHGKSATLLCPFCMQIFVCANRQEGVLDGNVNAFLQHLRLHKQSRTQKQCNRCRLTFTNMGQLRVHLFMDHGQMFARQGEKGSGQLQPISKSHTSIPRPKPKVPPAGMETFLRVLDSAQKLTLDVPNGKMCLECGLDYDTPNHIIGLVQCPVCGLQTHCLPFALEHTNKCSPLPQKRVMEQEYYCVCEYSTKDAVALIKHMVNCDRKSAYASVEQAQMNTFKEGVLDGLGLMRTEDGPADDGQHKEVEGEAEAAEEEQQPQEVEQSSVSAVTEMEGQDGSGTQATTTGDGESFISPEDYNPNLSLADLAPTPSVIVQHMPEAMRDDYQVGLFVGCGQIWELNNRMFSSLFVTGSTNATGPGFAYHGIWT